MNMLLPGIMMFMTCCAVCLHCTHVASADSKPRHILEGLLHVQI